MFPMGDFGVVCNFFSRWAINTKNRPYLTFPKFINLHCVCVCVCVFVRPRCGSSRASTRLSRCSCPRPTLWTKTKESSSLWCSHPHRYGCVHSMSQRWDSETWISAELPEFEVPRYIKGSTTRGQWSVSDSQVYMNWHACQHHWRYVIGFVNLGNHRLSSNDDWWFLWRYFSFRLISINRCRR
jgi:hypothetical protein